jgi:hypothetical protein
MMPAKATPKNPNGVAVGQTWGRRLHAHANEASDLVIEKVDLRNGVAYATSTKAFSQFGGRVRRTKIKLVRFTKGAGYHLKQEAV